MMSVLTYDFEKLSKPRFLSCHREGEIFYGSDVWSVVSRGDGFAFVADMDFENERDSTLCENLGMSFLPHPAAELPDFSPYALERWCVDRGIYPSETGLANLSRSIGYAECLSDTGDRALSAWLLHGIWQAIEGMGHHNRYPRWAWPDCPFCSGECVRNLEGSPADTVNLTFFNTETNEYESGACEGYENAPDAEIADIEPHTKVPASKTILYGEDQFNFHFHRYYAVNPAEWRELMDQYSSNNRDTDYSVLLSEAETKNKIASSERGHMAYCNLSEWSPFHDRIRYKYGINGGMIAGWGSDLAFKAVADGFKWDRSRPAWSLHT